MLVASVFLPIPTRLIRRKAAQILGLVRDRCAAVGLAVDDRKRHRRRRVRREREPKLRRLVGTVRDAYAVRHLAVDAAVEDQLIAHEQRLLRLTAAKVAKRQRTAHRVQRHVQLAKALHVCRRHRRHERVHPIEIVLVAARTD